MAMLAALGVALMLLELFRFCRAKKASYTCLCFREELLESGEPDMIVIVRTEKEADEVMRRICADEERKIYIKHI